MHGFTQASPQSDAIELHKPIHKKPMKNQILITAIATLFAACADDQGARSPVKAKAEPSRAEKHHESVARNREEGSQPPRIGMSKDEVLNKYGEPLSISSSSRGEMWLYTFNNFDATSLIPYYGPVHQAFKRRNSGNITFGSNGRVKDFTWNEISPKGATIFR